MIKENKRILMITSLIIFACTGGWDSVASVAGTDTSAF